jgi:hypothetical protein
MKRFCYLLLFALFVTLTLPTQSCARKSGCPAYETTKTKTKRNGGLSSKRGSTNLFPKKMRRGR